METPSTRSWQASAARAGASPSQPRTSRRTPPRRRARWASGIPALERLLPCANREDDQIAAEFRRLTEQGLRSRKAANLSTAILALANVEEQRVELGPAEAVAMVVALTDVRLVLGERLGLRTDEDLDELEAQVASLDDDDPAVYALAVYDFLTWLQETLAHALAP